MFYYVLEMAFIFLGGLFIFTQIILPPIVGKPMFWIFKQREQILYRKEDELNAAKTEGDIADMEAAIARQKDEVEAKIQRNYTRKKATNGGNETRQ